MNNNPKSTKDAAPESPAHDTAPAPEVPPYTAVAMLFQKGVERLAEMQKHTLDMVAIQTTDAIAMYKKAVPAAAPMPATFMMDLVDQGMERIIQSQKNMIDLAVQQSARSVEMSKERRESASKITSGMADMVTEAADRTVAAQKIMLDYAAEQNKAFTTAFKRQAGLTGSTPAAMAMDTFQRNVDMAIHTQKELLDAAAKPLKNAAH